MPRRSAPALCVLLLLAWAVPAQAAVRLPRVFSSNMVLQRGRPVPVWGWAEPGEAVVISVAGQQKAETADAAGRWRVTLEPMKAASSLRMTVKGANTVTFENVAVGEVWVCSGQSNMAMPLHPINTLRGALNYKQEIASADHPDLRLLTVPRKPSEKPLDDLARRRVNWVVCSPRSVKFFSALAYFFGRDLQRHLRVPVGVINSSIGGTPAEAWTPAARLVREPTLRHMVEEWPAKRAAYLKKAPPYRAALREWREKMLAARKRGERHPRPPRPPHPLAKAIQQPGALYNGMVAPLIPFAIRGVIWNQGESNSGRAYQYRTLFPALIESWRKAWGQGAFPFLFVQLPNVGRPESEPCENPRAELREAQLLTWRNTPDTGMAVAVDIGDANTTHGRNKQALAARLCLVARAAAYGEKVVYSGPVCRDMRVRDGRVVLRFDHVGGGLVAKGGPLKQFAVAGADRKFAWARAEIQGQTVVVWSPDVPKPVAVRYAWALNPAGANLYNKEGLPASPFRTDDWPGVTRRK